MDKIQGWHIIYTQEVTGSSPVPPTIQKTSELASNLAVLSSKADFSSNIVSGKFVTKIDTQRKR
jgi:hypothetical protein